MFKFKIDKEAIELLCEVMKKNSLSEIEVKRGNRSIKLSKNNNQTTKSSFETTANTTKNTKNEKSKKNCIKKG